MSGLRYPNINAVSEREQLNQIKSYLRQLVDNLNYELQNTPTQEGTKTEQTIVASKGKGEQTPVSEILQAAMPVGHIYISVSASNPSDLFGFGTWERLKDTFLLASGDTYAAGTTGGEAEHTLEQSEIPDYKIGFLPVPVMGTHGQWSNGGITSSRENRNNRYTVTATGGTSDPQYGWDISTNGGSQPHNNMPPYTTVYVWKRTA